nr:hypothetical protein [uncultured bacterium]
MICLELPLQFSGRNFLFSLQDSLCRSMKNNYPVRFGDKFKDPLGNSYPGPISIPPRVRQKIRIKTIGKHERLLGPQMN